MYIVHIYMNISYAMPAPLIAFFWFCSLFSVSREVKFSILDSCLSYLPKLIVLWSGHASRVILSPIYLPLNCLELLASEFNFPAWFMSSHKYHAHTNVPRRHLPRHLSHTSRSLHIILAKQLLVRLSAVQIGHCALRMTLEPPRPSLCSFQLFCIICCWCMCLSSDWKLCLPENLAAEVWGYPRSCCSCWGAHS